MGWMGSEIGCRGQNLLLILDLWGSLRSQGPQSGLCAPWPPCPPPLIPTAPGQAFPLSQLTPGSPDSVPPGRECVPQGWHWMGVRYANEFLCDSGFQASGISPRQIRMARLGQGMLPLLGFFPKAYCETRIQVHVV